MKRMVTSNSYIRATDDEDTRVDDMIKSLKDDFDYVLDSIDKLSRLNKVSDALRIMEQLNEAINDAIAQSAEQIVYDGRK